LNCGAGRGYSKATFQFSAARKRAFSVKRCGGVCALAAHKLHHTFLQMAQLAESMASATLLAAHKHYHTFL